MKLILNWSKQQWLGMDAYQKVRSILAALFVLLNIVKTRSVILHSHYWLWYRGCKHLDSPLSH